jgi:hypothetical protein
MRAASRHKTSTSYQKLKGTTFRENCGPPNAACFDYPLPHRAINFINWVAAQPGVSVRRAPTWNVTDPLILTTTESSVRGAHSGRLIVRINLVARPSDSAGTGSGFTRGSGAFRSPGRGVIDYVEERHGGSLSLRGRPSSLGPSAEEYLHDGALTSLDAPER